MELLEKVVVAFIKEVDEKCPFKEGDEGVDDDEEEGIEDDDDDGVQAEQANNGGTLGENLTSGSQGKGGTFVKDDPGPEYKVAQERMRVYVPESNTVEADEYPVTTAAHHLIPGNAALGRSKIYDFLGPAGSGKLKDDGAVRKRKNVKCGGQTYEIKKHIGYNINGCHNGAWLPGNYAIRKYQPKKKKSPAVPNTSPIGGPRGGMNWGDLPENFDEWKFNYVAAATNAAGGQFHDTHSKYSNKVLDSLNKISAALMSHLAGRKCDCCSKEKVPPPFTVKGRLYAISGTLRSHTISGVARWKAPFFTSDYWSEVIFSSKLSHQRFMAARRVARKVG